MTEPRQNREFTNFNDFDNDGWGNSTIEPRYIPEEKEEEQDEDYPIENENTVIVLDKGNWGVSNTEK